MSSASRTITLPHNFQPRPYQIPLLTALDNGILRAVIVWHRRSGKDKTCFNYMVKRAFQRVGTYFYFLPSYTQAKKVIWDNIDADGFRMLEHIPREVIKATNATELKIELKNGSIIQLIAADEFKQSGVGTNPIGVVFSEFSITTQEAWQYVSPILAQNGGWAVFNFTPRGMNHAYTLFQNAKDNPKWFWQLLTVADTNVFSAEALAEEKRNNPQAFFEQEYYCKFIEGAGQFFRRISQNIYRGEREHFSHTFQLGIDLAKYQDWTVITPFCLNCFWALPQERFNQVDWNLQKSRIEAAALRCNNAHVVVDSTGVGDPIAEDLQRTNLSVEGYKFTEITRRQLLDNLAVLLEQDKIKLPDDEGLISELQSFSFTLSETGKVKVGVPEGLHDDRVFSLALAVWQATQPIKQERDDQYKLYVQDFA
jgi:hypothetical protein